MQQMNNYSEYDFPTCISSSYPLTLAFCKDSHPHFEKQMFQVTLKRNTEEDSESALTSV